jgi:hypothetical protein
MSGEKGKAAPDTLSQAERRGLPGRITFISERNGSRDLYTVSPSAGTPRRLMGGPGAVYPAEAVGDTALLAVTVFALYGIGAHAPESFLRHFTVFVLSCFIGWQVIWNVTPSLHTPLMSVTNAISGIIVIGAMLHLAQAESIAVGIMAFVAVLIASINVGGGFRVTHRMLKMFRK